jgi:hypothetical protein
MVKMISIHYFVVSDMDLRALWKGFQVPSAYLFRIGRQNRSALVLFLSLFLVDIDNNAERERERERDRERELRR